VGDDSESLSSTHLPEKTGTVHNERLSVAYTDHTISKDITDRFFTSLANEAVEVP
jgi:hypothetical protein